jgi:spermidine synthase
MSRERRIAFAVGVAVFLSGAVLLGLEITASRVLAPTFGSSLYVWGSLIGIVLTGLAIGYWGGGVVADRMPTPYLLVSVLTLGAVLVALVPVVDETVLAWIVEWDPGPRLDPLRAAAILFGPASVVLASASPIAVRLAARSLERLGRTAGRLFSISTAGSIFGTFVTAFWLVPEVGTDQVLAVGAATLVAAALVVAVAVRLVPAAAVLAGALVAAVALAVSVAPDAQRTLSGVAAQNWSPLYRLRENRKPGPLDPASIGSLGEHFKVRVARDTHYHRLFVVDDADSRYLRFDSSFQSGMWLANPYRTRFDYTDYLDLGLAHRPSAEDVLFIGLGGGSAPKRMWRDFPRLQLQVVELDPEVVDAAYRWFALPRDPRLTVDVDDGRRWLARHDKRWDVIVIDAFYADSIPFHLATHEFLQLVRTRLSPGGVVVVNIIGALRGDQSKLLRSLTKTYRASFPTVLLYPVFTTAGDTNPTYVANVILVATDSAAPSQAFLRERWREIRKASPTAPELDRAIRNRWERGTRFDDVPVLTDDYAPTDALLTE